MTREEKLEAIKLKRKEFLKEFRETNLKLLGLREAIQDCNFQIEELCNHEPKSGTCKHCGKLIEEWMSKDGRLGKD